MGRIARFFGLEKKAETYAEIPLEEWARFLGGNTSTKSGVSVNAASALKVSTVLACTRRWAEAICVPVKVYQKTDGGVRREASDHPLNFVLSSEPNSAQSGFEFRETIGYHLALRGNSFVLKTTIRGAIDELIPLVPEYVTVNTGNDGLIKSYSYKPAKINLQAEFSPEEIWHLRGPSWDSLVGIDAVRTTNEAIALAMATEETHSRLHANGLRPSAHVSSTKPLNENQLVRFAAFVKQQMAGMQNAGGVLVTDSDAKFTPMDMKGVDAQHLELRNFQVEEICRGFSVLPIMVGHTDKAATYASSEQMFLAHLVHTVRPLHDRVASSMDRWLLTKEERKDGYYTAFKEEAFLSPAMKDKAEYRKAALGGGATPGWLTQNEIRAHDELPPMEGGDNLYAPTNTGPIGPDGIPKVPQKEPSNGP